MVPTIFYLNELISRFIKSTAFEIHIPEEIKNEERYSARFIDEIYDEIDVLEDKKAPLFSKIDYVCLNTIQLTIVLFLCFR